MTSVLEDFDWLVFDLGGVLIELDGPPISPSASSMAEREIWDTWLESKAVRNYESGLCDRTQFASSLIAEFRLSCSEEALLEMFRAWPVGFYAEVETLMQNLSGRVKLACLSNTNELHWQRFSEESEIFDYFDEVFLSFEMGLMKPDREIFSAAEKTMKAKPGRVLYLDDNETIIQAARACGWNAHHSQGFDEVIAGLKKHRVL